MSDSEEYEEDDRIVIIDNGSHTIKCGFSGETLPRIVFPTVCGRPMYPGVMVGMGKKDAYIGDEALTKRGILRIKNPIEYGTIHNWDDMEKIWHHTFYNELRVAPEEHPILLTDKIPYSPKLNREKITQIMFETFDAPAFQIAYQSTLALFSVGKTSGITVDSSYQTTYCIPIVEGKVADQKYIQSSDIGGKQITDYLQKLLIKENDVNLNRYSERGHIVDIKKKLCFSLPWNVTNECYADYLFNGYLRKDIERQLPMDVVTICDKYAGTDGEYDELPDKSKIWYVSRKMKTSAVEYLFNPSLNGDLDQDKIGIHELCGSVMKKLKNNTDGKNLKDVLFFGGNAMLKGVRNRFEQEMKAIDAGVKVIASAKQNKDGFNEDYCVWIGGSVITQLASFEEMWIKKEEYDETGPTIVHCRCV